MRIASDMVNPMDCLLYTSSDPNLSGRNFAVIIDEAHSAQEGSSAAALKSALNMASDKLKFAVAKETIDRNADSDMTDEDMVTE